MKSFLITSRRIVLLSIGVCAMVVALESVLIPNSDDFDTATLLPGLVNFSIGVLAWVWGCR